MEWNQKLVKWGEIFSRKAENDYAVDEIMIS